MSSQIINSAKDFALIIYIVRVNTNTIIKMISFKTIPSKINNNIIE